MPGPSSRELLSAEILSIGSELTVGETRDTNAGELARSLTEAGVRRPAAPGPPRRPRRRPRGVPGALHRADLVVSTGGLGPTPDDLTREAIAAASGETPDGRSRSSRPGCTRCGTAAACRSRRSTSSRPGASRRRRRSRTATARRPAGGSTGRTAGSSSRCRAAARDAPDVARLGPAAAARPRARAPTWHRRRTGWPGSASRLVADRLGEELLRATEPGRRDVCAAGRRRRPDQRAGRRRPAGRGARRRRRPRSSGRSSATTSGPTGETTWAEAIDARLAELGWTLVDARDRAPAARSPTCSGPRPRLAVRRRSVPTAAAGAGRAGAQRSARHRRPTSPRGPGPPAGRRHGGQRRRRDAGRDAPRVARWPS